MSRTDPRERPAPPIVLHLDPHITYDEISPYPKVRQRHWSAIVHEPLEAEMLAAIRTSAATGLPYGAETWVDPLAKQLDLDLTIRPRDRHGPDPFPTGRFWLTRRAILLEG